MHRNLLCAALLGALSLAPVASATGARPVDPNAMERAARVANPGPIDARIVGAWDVWIPGAVYYTTDGVRVNQHYQAGAAMNRLEIARDGSYRWGDARGRLEEVRPWHAQADRRYFRVVHASGDEYEFYYGSGDKLVVLFGGVGGHAATGTRLGGARPAPTSAPAPAPAPAPAGNNPLGVEWVGNNAGSNANPPAPATNNPLGVEWRGNNAPAPQPATGGQNPLGVEWRSGPATGATPPPAPPPPVTPADPVAPAPPVAPPDPVAPTPPATGLAAALTDRWRYIGAAYHGNGRVDNAPDVGGTLEFKPDGEYVQSLVIGGIGNNITGRWRVADDRVVTSYLWRGQPASDRMSVHLSADGKRLTLVTDGSPKAYYTLDRTE